MAAPEKKTPAQAKKKEAGRPAAKAEKKPPEAAKTVKKPETRPVAEERKLKLAPTKKPAEKPAEEKPAPEKPVKAEKIEKAEKPDEAGKPVKPAAKEVPAKKAEEKKAVKEKKKKPAKRKAKPVEKIQFLAEKKPSKEGKDLISRKKAKPKFSRQELYKIPRLKEVWRKSRGIDSKKHEGKRGKGWTPNPGYKNPEILRGIHITGYYPVNVCNIKDLDKINPGTQAAVIAASIGRKKRNEIIKTANDKKVFILNPRKKER